MKHRLFPVVFFILLVLSGCLSAPPSGGGPAAEEGPAVRQFFAMDTLMSVSVYGPQGEAAVQEAWEVLTGLDRLLSRTSSDSEISALNAHAGDGSWVPLSPETAGAVCFDRESGETIFVSAPLVPGQFHGTGDLFASVLSGALVRGWSLTAAARLAADTPRSCPWRTSICILRGIFMPSGRLTIFWQPWWITTFIRETS